MATSGAAVQSTSSSARMLILGALVLAFGIRLLHVSFAMLSPLTYQLGPDEDYYLRFGQAVAAANGQDTAEFTFMDPAYGFLLGGLFKVFGVNLFVVFLLQALIDSATCLGILIIGRQLGRARAGIYGSLLYAVASTAIMFCTAVLKEVWVTSYVTWWVVAALAVLRSERRGYWVAFGIYCALGITLRSTLLLLSVVAILLPTLSLQPGVHQRSHRAASSALLLCGLLAGLLPCSLRNYHAFGSLSPLPHNGGIVLHQTYNADNPSSSMWIPPFVNYSSPSEIWRGYAAEATLRLARPLSPAEVDRYWRDDAATFLQRHPDQLLGDLWRKSLNFLSSNEIPSSRYDAEEKLFSPVMRLLPAPIVWLLALGLSGLCWLGIEDRRWPVIAAPVLLAALSCVIFLAESRFRFHAASILALCSGIWIDRVLCSIRTGGKGAIALFGLLAGMIATASLYLGYHASTAPMRWDRIVWGYIKMGRLSEAQAIAQSKGPDDGPLIEALGYIAVSRKQYQDAARDFRRAIELRPRSHIAHYNLARVLLALGDRDQAAVQARLAWELNPSPEYSQLQSQIASE